MTPTQPETIHTIQYVACELPPLLPGGFNDPDPDPTIATLRPEYQQLPANWEMALRYLASDVDKVRCDNDCGSPVGYYLDVDCFVQWRITYLARLDDRGIVRLCEDCSPACPTAPPVLRADPRS